MLYDLDTYLRGEPMDEPIWDFDDDYDEPYYGWGMEYEEVNDEWYPVSCGNPRCIMPSGHFASECCTAADMEEYYAQYEYEQAAHPLSKLWWFVRLLLARHKTDQQALDLHWMWRVEFADWLDRHGLRWPRKCPDCGRRFRACDPTVKHLPF